MYKCFTRLSLMSYPFSVEQGLTFLHEHRIAGLSCSEPSSYMVDLSSGRTTTSPSTPASELHESPVMYFDRTAFPVRYYFVNFTNAQRVSSRKDYSSSPVSPADGNSLFSCPFKKDVQECGTMIDNMLINASFWLFLFLSSLLILP